ncbi:hypothetical protein BJ170DRAFT_460087 [Xylariales sp. AK1849]|nr:hypothetical protein BJ170DRAFT_460087 [Xylariales sp. AK1849]
MDDETSLNSLIFHTNRAGINDDETSLNLLMLHTKVKQDDGWHGQLPCVSCYSHRGCHQHNPTRSPLYRNPRLPPKELPPKYLPPKYLPPKQPSPKEPPPKKQHLNRFTRVLSWFCHNCRDAFRPKETAEPKCEPLLTDTVSDTATECEPLLTDTVLDTATECEPLLTDTDWETETECEPLLTDIVLDKDPEPSRRFYTKLPFDSHLVDTLAPIHPTMPYHLAFYHLDCIRRQRGHNVRVAFIPELSCGGTSNFYHNGPEYTWSSEIYFHKESFLQKQEISCMIDEKSNCRTLEFTECPHITFRIEAPRFEDNDGFAVVQTRLTIPPPVYGPKRNSGPTWWTSKIGRFARLNGCRRCHSDHELTLELVGRQLYIRNTCYRELGAATDRSMPKWISLLTGTGIVRRPDDYTVYARVWQTAQELYRPNIPLITHTTRYWEFVVGSVHYEPKK